MTDWEDIFNNTSYIYVAANDSMPDRVKIGYSHDPDTRMAQLSKDTGVSEKFYYIDRFQCYRYEIREAERKVHEALARYRISDNREFFYIYHDDRCIHGCAIKKALRTHLSESLFEINNVNQMRRALQWTEDEMEVFINADCFDYKEPMHLRRNWDFELAAHYKLLRVLAHHVRYRHTFEDACYGYWEVLDLGIT